MNSLAPFRTPFPPRQSRPAPALAAASALAVLAAAMPWPLQATPYASNLTNNNGTVSFRLNESADNVKVLWNGGANEADLGPRGAGLHVANVGASGTFQVRAFKVSPPGFVTPIAPNQGGIVQISTDSSLTRFTQPRGLVVNNDPSSPYFGRVYVSNADASAVTNFAFQGTRTLQRGIYLLNSDLSDALGRGDAASTAGIALATTGTGSPYRLSLGPEGNLYIADWSDAVGSLYVTDPDVSPGSGANVLGGPVGSPFPVTATRIHGSIAAAVVEGTLAAGNLTAYVIDEDLQPDRASTTQNARNSLWRHDIGGTLPGPEVLPARIGTTPWINFASQTMDLSRSPDGKFYVNNYRSVGTDRGGLYVLGADGAVLWNSLAVSLGLGFTNDLLRATGAGALSPRGDFYAVINLETNGITVLPLNNGIPDLANRLVFHGMQSTSPQGRELAFDLAGNLYVLSQGTQLLRVFSPGGTTTTVTGSDGTFSILRPPGVSVAVANPAGAEAGPSGITYTITREGDTSTDLTVLFTFTGTATPGVDFPTNVLTATIPAGQTSVDVVVTPTDDNESEFTETVTLFLQGASNYDLKVPAFASGYIVDNDPAVITISALDTNAQERFASDTLVFVISRRGDTNSELFVSYDLTGSSALPGADYPELPTQFYFPPGSIETRVTIAAQDDAELEGAESVCIAIVPGFDPYTVGVPGSACAQIQDDEVAPGLVYFADAFNADTSADWVVRFGANNQVYDADYTFGFDYSTLGVPVAPSTVDGSTRGLYVRVNKNDATVAGAAGINFYPAGRSFSGNYALRFDMYLNYGAAATTEHGLAGLNHSSLLTNRVSQSTTDTNNTTRGGDGVWVAIATDASNNRDYTAYTATNQAAVPAIVASRTAASLTGLIPAPPYAVAGSPGKGWSRVELSQINNVVALKVNNNLIFQFNNTNAFKSGNIMIGHSDQFDSIGSPENYAVFDNLRVINLDFRIARIALPAADRVEIDFASPLGGRVSDLRLQGATSLSAPDWTDLSAEIVATPEGFRATAARTPGTTFYRVKRQ